MTELLAWKRLALLGVFYFTLYSLGLRLGEGLHLQMGDIDAVRQRVQIRDVKGNRDRFVPMPQATHQPRRRFWSVHRNPVLLFPNHHGGLKGAATATTPMDAGSVKALIAELTVEALDEGVLRRLPCLDQLEPGRHAGTPTV